jgi:Mannosyltransferase (PIG-V)
VSAETLSAAPPRARWLGSPFAPGLVLYVVARLVTLLIVALSDLVSHHGVVASLSTWDGTWFLRAAGHGWPSHLPMTNGAVAANTIAFFPLFPLLLRALHELTGLSAAVLGLWVSALAGALAVVAVGAVARAVSDDDVARRASVLFALSPGAFVFSLIYNEGFVVALAALGLWALMTRRWLVAGVAGAVATATSPVGLIFVVVAAWSAARAVVRERDWGALVAPALAPAGFLAWMLYLWAHTGTLRAWQLTERGGWNSYPSLMYPVRVIGKFVTNPLSPTMTGQLLVAGTVVAVGGLVLVVRERLPGELVLYALSAVVLFAISAPVGLRPRFIMLVFPFVIAAAMRWRGRAFVVVASLSALGLALMSVETLHSWAIFP